MEPAIVRTSDFTSMEAMLAAARSGAGTIRTDDGWRRPLTDIAGFRHEYDGQRAQGGWEFCILRPGLYIARIDFTASEPTPRRHSYADHLVLSAMLSGDTAIRSGQGAGVELTHGYCTVYGNAPGDEFLTMYEAGRPLKWVTVFIDRHAFFESTGFRPEELPPRITGFLANGESLGHRNVLLSAGASLAAKGILECPFNGGFKRVFLTAKALELACHILFLQGRAVEEDFGEATFSPRDYEKLARAKKMLETTMDAPLNVPALAATVGLARSKLQLGFRLVYGDTVGQIRDRIRMEHALELLRSSRMSVVEIALESGYHSPASFTRAFKASFGISPGRMRREGFQSQMLGKLARRDG